MPISSEDFRDVLRHFPSGVTVVTIKPYGSDEVHGLTVSAFASISPEPPLILISIDHRAHAYPMMETAGTTFAVNILSHDQMEISNRFAWLKDEDRFAGLETFTLSSGAPLLHGGLACLDCRVHSAFEAGNHTLFIGEVIAVRLGTGLPLLYYDRGYRQLTGL